MNMLFKTINQNIVISSSDFLLDIKREDLIHPFVSGNKFRKLKYNLLEAKNQNQSKLVTFGGAFSNHIAAVAYAGKENGFKTIGIIRGEELENRINENSTLQFAHACGMQFDFISRESYRYKEIPDFLNELKLKYKDFYLIPEGGTNELAIKGCEEILTEDDEIYDFVCCCVGTGGTISGLINGSKPSQKIIGFSALKGDFLRNEIRKFAKKDNWELISEYHFGGYGKVTEELILFMNSFLKQNGILLDPIYTAKMVFGVIDLINKNYFPKNSKILIIHSGGLQGIEGMNAVLKNKNKTLIQTNV
jgi:1-aminocyclopropane-1-carboxylate deaminase